MSVEICTWGGTIFDIENPSAENVTIEDIAKSLACTCRYTGHCNDFYSVAQHSVLMANLTEFDGMGTPLQRLLHDSAEAYIGDISSPFKCNLYFGKKGCQVKTLEKRIQKVIGEALGVDLENLNGVKKADNIMMATEMRDLMHANIQKICGWVNEIPRLNYPIDPWDWRSSYELFLKSYYDLKKKEKPDGQSDTSES